MQKLSLLLLVLLTSCEPLFAEEFTNHEICEAIDHAENSTKYPYGIRSIDCRTRTDCAKICWNTVKHNKQRYARYGFKSYPDFISFLGARYAPIGAGNDPQKLNENWVKNVKWFLNKKEK